jgi:hypothetical protein
MSIKDYGEEAANVFVRACHSYEANHDQESFDLIKELLAEAKVMGDAQKYGLTIAKQAMVITYFWQDFHPKDIQLRSYKANKTVEKLKQEDEEAERKHKQSEAWRAQGLCRYCGGQLGMFKKCKSCGSKN